MATQIHTDSDACRCPLTNPVLTAQCRACPADQVDAACQGWRPSYSAVRPPSARSLWTCCARVLTYEIRSYIRIGCLCALPRPTRILLAGAPTLCDEMKGWHSECLGSDPDRCEVHVGSQASALPTSCEVFCERQGMWCEGAWDDGGAICQRGGTSRAWSSHQAFQCTVSRSSQVCSCRRDCADNGPWDCHEEGCPARSVSCAILRVACNARFGDIWRKPPRSVAHMRVAQACPLTCGTCACARLDGDLAEGPARLPAGAGLKAFRQLLLEWRGRSPAPSTPEFRAG